jgi:calcineurin-like phosphoesterase family protein
MASERVGVKRVLFAADLHADHRNIISYCGRPWATREEMMEQLVANWNRRAQPDTIIWMVGDMFIDHHVGRVRDKLQHFHGQIKLVPGNHDAALVTLLTESGGRLEWDGGSMDLMAPLVELRGVEYPQPLVLCHYALERWPRGWHLHGHSHPRAVEGGAADLGCGLTRRRDRINLCYDVVHHGQAPHLWTPLTWSEVVAKIGAHNREVGDGE